MITPKQLKAIDITYFTILASGSFTVTLQSRNTGHCWHILFQEYPHFKSCLIYHTHHKGSPYHRHGHSPSLPRMYPSDKAPRCLLAQQAEKYPETDSNKQQEVSA